MSTGTKIIQNALKMSGAYSIAQPIDAQALADGRDVLNSMIEALRSDGIEFGAVPLDAPGDELGEPTDATFAITSNLALLLAPYYDNGKVTVSRRLEVNAERSLAALENHYQQHSIPKMVVSGTLPRGEGHSRGLANRVFFGNDATISDETTQT